MRNRASSLRRHFAIFVCAGLSVIAGSFNRPASAAPQKSPVLYSVSASSTRAIVLETVSLVSEPFSLNMETNFNASDPRTRISLFGTDFDFLQGEGANALSADAQDGAGTLYALKVEYVGTVPNFSGVFMVVLRLNDSMTSNLGDVLVRLNLHGMSSNRVRVAIGQIGGGPADDPGATGTPAPSTPPAAATPLTLAEFQAQAGAPAAVAGADGIRFLEQATFGPTDADLQHLRVVGIQGYLNEQFNAPISSYPILQLYPTDSTQGCPSGSPATCGRDNYTMYPLQVAFYNRALNTGNIGNNDQLRQRVSWALSQIVVVSGQTLPQPSWVGPYLTKLDQDAFTNYRTILQDVTLNPGMGDYLDMVNNNRTAPNENYAREVMQLFSIGLDQLNNDGTPKLDANGNRIPTYDQARITNFARVFTGWVFAAAKTFTPPGGSTLNVPNYQDPMVVRETNHDTGSKTLLNGTVLPACTNCTLSDTNAALDNLFNHPNTGPFICKQLIQHLVTSNPSPAYVDRVATVFNNNRANPTQMQEVIKAILLDPEARGDLKTDPNYGHLKESVLFITNMLRPYITATDGSLNTQSSPLGENVFNSPTVFNYYPADYGIPGTNLFGPTFGILTTTTALGRANLCNTLFLGNGGNGLPPNGVNTPTGTQIHLGGLDALADNPTALVDELGRILLHSNSPLSGTPMGTSIITAVNAISASNPITATQRRNRAQQAIYLVASSSQFQVSR